MGTTMPESFEEMWAALLPIGRSETGGYERRGLGETERQLHDWLAARGVSRGLEVERDAAGNTLLWWGGGTDAVLTGSHLDSVPRGGAYDGPLGVVSGLPAIDLLPAEGFEPARPIGVGAFVDEEGAGSGQARLSGARATMARFEVVPNATDALPALVTTWLDARGQTDEILRALVGEIARQGSQRADRDGTALTVTPESVSPAVAFDPGLVQRLATLLEAEHATPQDCLAGVDALTTVLRELAG